MFKTRKSVESLRQTLAKEAAGGARVDEIGATVIALAELEGFVDTIEGLEEVRKSEWGLAGAKSLANDLLLRGADDKWSGRRNDFARARFDGVRDAIRDARYGGPLDESGE